MDCIALKKKVAPDKTKDNRISHFSIWERVLNDDTEFKVALTYLIDKLDTTEGYALCAFGQHETVKLDIGDTYALTQDATFRVASINDFNNQMEILIKFTDWI